MPREKDFQGKSRLIYFRVSEDVGKKLDGLAAAHWMNLSSFVRELIRKALQEQNL